MVLGPENVKGVRDNPLGQNEVRRIVGMGELYLALADCKVDKNCYAELSEIFIDDISYKFYRRIKKDATLPDSV